MSELIYTTYGEIGRLHDMFINIPFLVCTLKVGDKEYSGHVQTITMQGVQIISGKFHPYLDLNFFEAFDIYPNRYEMVNYIDIKWDGEQKDSPFNVLAFSHLAFNNFSVEHVHLLDKIIPDMLPFLKKSILEYGRVHPEIEISLALSKVEMLIAKIELLKTNASFSSESANAVVTTIKNYITDLMSALIFCKK